MYYSSLKVKIHVTIYYIVYQSWHFLPLSWTRINIKLYMSNSYKIWKDISVSCSSLNYYWMCCRIWERRTPVWPALLFLPRTTQHIRRMVPSINRGYPTSSLCMRYTVWPVQYSPIQKWNTLQSCTLVGLEMEHSICSTWFYSCRQIYVHINLIHRVIDNVRVIFMFNTVSVTLQCILYFLFTDVRRGEIWRGRAGGLGSISPAVTGCVRVC